MDCGRCVDPVETRCSPPFDITLFQILKNEDGDPDTYNVPFGNYPIDKPFTFPNSGIGTAFRNGFHADKA
jgi:hypothetical protein